MAARAGNVEVLQVLKEFSSASLQTLMDPDAVERTEGASGKMIKWTPLLYAVHNAHFAVIEFLLFEVGWGDVTLEAVLDLAKRAVEKGKAEADWLKELEKLKTDKAYFQQKQQAYAR